MQRAQIRAARALLGWTQTQLAEAAGVSLPTIKRIEPGDAPTGLNEETAGKIQAAVEKAGVIFVAPGALTGVAGAGVRFSDMPWDTVPQPNVHAMVLNSAVRKIERLLDTLEERGADVVDTNMRASIADIRSHVKGMARRAEE